MPVLEQAVLRGNRAAFGEENDPRSKTAGSR
jgi:hypothetical protein